MGNINLQSAKNLIDSYFMSHNTMNFKISSALFECNYNIRNISIEDTINNVFYLVEHNHENYLLFIRDYNSEKTIINSTVHKSFIVQYYNSLKSNELIFQLHTQLNQFEILLIDILMYFFTNHLKFNLQDTHNIVFDKNNSYSLTNTRDVFKQLNIIRQISNHE